MTLSVLSASDEVMELAANLERWQDDPASFVREVIGASPDPWQVSVLHDLRHFGRVTVAACHGPGKDAVAAWAVLWCLLCWEHPKVPCTAPTGHQLYDLLWAEVAKWRAKMLPYFADLLEVKKDRIEYKEHADTWFAAARTARKENPEALQGFHADVILVVVDEASGVPAVIFEVLEGAMTGPLCFMLLIGNPTQTTGDFHASHHSDRERWRAYRILAASAHDGSELPPRVFTSERVSPKYVESIGKKYGRDSNVYRVRVLGLFPTSEDDQTVLLEWVEAACQRELPPGWTPIHFVTVGVDVARFGSDDSALCVRQGPKVLHLETWHGHDEDNTAGKVVAACKRMQAQNLLPAYIFVDANGVGAGVVKRLLPNPWLAQNRVSVVGVNAGAKSPDAECARLRDALWWRARKCFDPKGGGANLGGLPVIPPTLPRDLVERLTGELASPKFGFTPDQRIKVEGKDEMKARGIGSPDLADAYLLTLYFEAGMPKVRKPGDPYDPNDDPRKNWATA